MGLRGFGFHPRSGFPVQTRGERFPQLKTTFASKRRPPLGGVAITIHTPAEDWKRGRR